ncbi:MAG: 3-deoxy-D-manno-octulosonic acid transferase, partial [Hyphomonadaceae bacterium]
MSLPPGLALYRAASGALAPLAHLWLAARARRGKEERARLGERFGRSKAARPEGRLVWLHGASVGEMGVLLQVREGLAARDPALSFLVTTGTRASAELFARRAPARTRHVYAPLDTPRAARRFLAHWRPDLGVFVESELWPNLIMAARAQGVRLALTNARMSPEPLARWRRLPRSAAHMLGGFSLLLAADAATAAGLSALSGEPVRAVGNLKLAAPAPPVDQGALAAFKAAIGARPLWLAASTHAGEDEIVLAAHAR